MNEYLPLFQQDLTFYIFCIYCIVVLIQFIYVFYFFLRLAFYRNKENIKYEKCGVSVIIAARNEEDNLYKFLPLILDQDYPEFEVLVINHQSVDESYQVLNSLKILYPNKLRVIEIERNKHLGSGKKFPLSIGIKAAKYNHLILTDADCEPTSNQWINYMVSKFSDKKQLVLGFAPYRKEKGLLNKIIRFDTLMIAVNYLSFALSKIPYMGVGRNIAYTKDLYDSVKGFKSHYSIISGDDDLFVQEAAKKRNYTIQIDEKSHCYSKTKKTWTELLTQKSRHYSASIKYKKSIKLLLGLYPFSLILAWSLFTYFIFNNEFKWLCSLIFIILIIIKWWIQGKCFAKLKNNKFIWLLPFTDLIYALITPFIYYSFDKNKILRWK